MTHPNAHSLADLNTEMAGVRLGDARLDRRLQAILARAQARPDASFPQMMANDAELEALYRFVRNDKVTPDRILSPHFDKTASRCADAGPVVVAHDTSQIDWAMPEDPDGVGYVHGKKRGFFLHASLAVSRTDDGLPLGLLQMEVVNRATPSKPKVHWRKRHLESGRESERWLRGVDAAREQAGPDADLVHVMDREADDFALFASLVARGEDFVIRVCHDRRTLVDRGESRLFEDLGGAPHVATREVPISRRAGSKVPRTRKIHPPREARLAGLHVRTADVTLVKPAGLGGSFPDRLDLRVVHVFEPEPPEGEAPVDWKLITSRALASVDEALDVVDVYRTRWVIEEYFKALKTGTALHERQAESFQTIQAVLALSLPLAWRLLVLRSYARNHPDTAAERLVSSAQIEILRTMGRRKLPERPTLWDVTLAIAAMGGHLTRNGPPGWKTLGKGMQELMTMERVWLVARGAQEM